MPTPSLPCDFSHLAYPMISHLAYPTISHLTYPMISLEELSKQIVG